MHPRSVLSCPTYWTITWAWSGHYITNQDIILYWLNAYRHGQIATEIDTTDITGPEITCHSSNLSCYFTCFPTLLPHVFIICKIHWNLLREREYRCFMLANVVLIQPEAAFFKVCVSQLSVVCAAACLVGKDKIIDEWVFCCQIFQGIELEDTWARAHFLCDCATFGWITPIYHLSAMAQTEVEMGIRRYRYYSIISYIYSFSK